MEKCLLVYPLGKLVIPFEVQPPGLQGSALGIPPQSSDSSFLPYPCQKSDHYHVTIIPVEGAQGFFFVLYFYSQWLGESQRA